MTLILHDFIQYNIGKFLDSKNLMNLKMTCRCLFIFEYNVHVSFDAAYHLMKLVNMGPLKIDTTGVKKLDIEKYDHENSFFFRSWKTNCLCNETLPVRKPWIHTLFDTYEFINLVTLYLGNYSYILNDKHISQLINLKNLSMGSRNKFTNAALIGLTKLEWLYLVDNQIMDSKIFTNLPNLKYLQISNVSKIQPEDVPESVGNVIIYMYMIRCIKCIKCSEFVLYSSICYRSRQYEEYEDTESNYSSHSNYSNENMDIDDNSDENMNIDDDNSSEYIGSIYSSEYFFQVHQYIKK